MEKLITSLDRAHRVLVGTQWEQPPTLPGRIIAGIIRMGCQRHLRILETPFTEKVLQIIDALKLEHMLLP
ncbi:unnamed protein product, partial [Rotaria sp. Silwood2]